MSDQPDVDDPGNVAGGSEKQEGRTNNSAGENSGVQSETFTGNFNSYNYTWYAESRKPPINDRRVSKNELSRARDHFVPCPGFGEALTTLQRGRLLFLGGDGTGRSLASVRMLHECGVTSMSRLSERRSFDSLAGAELEPRCGYIWDGVDSAWEAEITAASVDRVTEWAIKYDCWVIVIVNREISRDLRKYAESLGRPSPVDVALSVLQSQHGQELEAAEEILGAKFREHLPDGTAPNVAEYVAIRSWEVHTKDREMPEVLKDLGLGLRNAVFSWFLTGEERSPIEYAMLVAISVFENRDYDDVVKLAEELENMIYQADSGKEVVPRKIFEFSKSLILFRLNATISPHRHVDGRGLHKESVHFQRSGWAQQAFRRAWSEYDLLRPVVVDWMAKQAKEDGFQWYCAKALHDVLVNVPHADPLAHIDSLAGKQSRHANELAAQLLGRLAADKRTRHVVEPTLHAWCDGPHDFHRKGTAALVYATEYGQRRPEVALSKLAAIAQANTKLHSAVSAGVISVLDEPANRTLVLQELVRWTSPGSAGPGREQRESLRSAGLNCAQAALGLAPDTNYLRSLRADDRFGDPDSKLVAKLFLRLFQDERTFFNCLDTLLARSEDCAGDPTTNEAKGLAQLVATVAPDLHRAASHQLFERWKRVIPGRAAEISNAFRTLQLLHQIYVGSPEG